MRKITYVIAALLVCVAQSNSALADGELEKLQRNLQGKSLYNGDLSGELNLDTVISLSVACDKDENYCNDARKYASTFYFNRYTNVRYALISDKSSYSIFAEAFNYLKNVNKIESNGWSFVTAFMRAAAVSSIYFDGDVQGVFYYNPVLDISLVLKVNGGKPEKAFFVSGEAIRGESHTGKDFPQWIRDKSNPFARMETATKAVHKISRETQAAIIRNGLSVNSSLLNEEENNLVRNRLSYIFNGLSDEIGSCSKYIDKLVKLPGGMSSLEKKYNKSDPNAGVASSIVPFIPVGQFVFEDGIFRIYASQTDPEYVSALFIRDWTEDNCKPELSSTLI